MDFSLLGFSSLKEMFNVHPALVHYPSALIPAAFLLYFLGTVLKRKALLVSGRACLYLGVAGAIAAVWSGLRAEDSIPHNEMIHRLMETHEFIGITLLVIGAILTIWSFWQVDAAPKGTWVFLALLGFATYLTLQTGEIGGRMVFLEGAAVKPAVSIVTQQEEKEEVDESIHHQHHHGD